MRSLNLPVRYYGNAVWTMLFESVAFEAAHKDSFLAKLHSLEALREQAEYDTGSISTVSAWSLFAATRILQPECILEVGTFIGKSTIAMGLGADAGKRPCTVHTCDFSNDIKLPALCKSNIIQYPKKSSTAMIAEMHAQNLAGTVDFVHLDGRLTVQDLQALAALCTPSAVFAFDDFEGIEKGVVNYSKALESGLFPNRILIPPCPAEVARPFGFLDVSRTALWIPVKSINITAQ